MELEEWSTPLLSVFFAVLAASICFGIWKLRADRK